MDMEKKDYFQANIGTIGLFLICLSTAFATATFAEEAYLIADINPGEHDSNPSFLVENNGLVYFSAERGSKSTYSKDLWITDGTPDGITSLTATSGNHLYPCYFEKFGNLVIFSAGHSAPTRSDGTKAGTYFLINQDSFNSCGPDILQVNQKVFFSFTDGPGYQSTKYGNEVWKTDGTVKGTILVKDINPGPANGYPEDFANVGGILFFYANDGVHSFELWKSDGTSTGTVMVKDINTVTTGSKGPSRFDMAAMGNILIFAANDGTHGNELWRSDGTSKGTFLVKDIKPGPDNGIGWGCGHMRKAGGKIFFRTDDGTHGMEIWVTDGTTSGTHLVKDINPGPANGVDVYSDNPYVELNGILYFTALSPGYGSELWRSDGTEKGTWVVKDINPGSGNSLPWKTASLSGALYFAAWDPVARYQVWTSDGTSSGTRRLTNINPSSGCSPRYFARLKKKLLFCADDGIHGEELWGLDLATDVSPRDWEMYK